VFKKLIFKNIYIILMYFWKKYILKNNHYHTLRHPFKQIQLLYLFLFFFFFLSCYANPNFHYSKLIIYEKVFLSAVAEPHRGKRGQLPPLPTPNQIEAPHTNQMKKGNSFLFFVFNIPRILCMVWDIYRYRMRQLMGLEWGSWWVWEKNWLV
jgi:hypothetical protein